MTTPRELADLYKKIEKLNKTDIDKQVFVGFDGFIDKIKRPVKQKLNFNTVYYKTLREFSERINNATNRSGQVEMVTQKIKIGGNAPILSNTLGRLGIRSFCLGSLGYPERHRIFADMSTHCQAISALNPGESDAVEFDDGKLIFSELSIFNHYDWKHIKKTIGLEKIKNFVSNSHLLAFVDWVNLPHASDIWEGMLEEVIKPLGKSDFLFLFDLCDPSKKTTEQIDEVLDLISCFSAHGKVTPGLNENETLKIWSAIRGIENNDQITKTVTDAGGFIYRAMNIDYLLIHPIDRTILFHKRDVIEMQGRFVTEPKVLTGGGDNLNAGYCFGLLAGFSIQECMLLGMAASGAYIQNGVSPDKRELLDYISLWRNELIQLPVVREKPAKAKSPSR